MYRFFSIQLSLFAFVAGALNAQSDTLAPTPLQPVEVTATRFTTNELQTPYGLSVLDKTQLQSGRQQLSPAEFLSAVPGVFFMNADNFAQDLRVSIRGVGARSAFGIRGVRIMVDDLPETTPDGQGQIDNLDPGHLDRLEVIRGPAAGLYGNASGGVLSFRTEEVATNRFVQIGTRFGSFGFQQYQLKAGGRNGRWQYIAGATHVRLQGFREQSRMRNTIANLKIRFHRNENHQLLLIGNFAGSPVAEDAGALTAVQADTLPTQARDVNRQFNAGESVYQGRIGILSDSRLSAQSRLKIRLFHTFRDFENNLAFKADGIVAFRRNFSGAGVGYLFTAKPGHIGWQLHTGLDLERQADLRKRFANLDGERGDLSFEQLETYQNAGLFFLNEVTFHKKWALTANVRLDLIQVKAADRFVQNGDDSGSFSRRNLSPVLGIRYSVSETVHVYANLSTAFDMPTLSELSANPDGSGGFNTGLLPQQTVGGELGIKGLLQHKLRYEAAFFYAVSRNELAPYELQNFPGRTFYRNSGRTERTGLEMSLTWMPGGGIQCSANYTLAAYRYVSYMSGGYTYDGKRIPGLPEQTGAVEVRYTHKKGPFAIFSTRYVGALFADDANNNRVAEFWLLNLRAGWPLHIGKTLIEPSIGLNNLADTRYSGNIRINAFGGRYYEPAPGVNWYAGVMLRF
ncbi:MAG: TonB-dependent receptor [Saprospiraceae bacterium]|nr:TonB-dependent receptor [Saprospiraceae bacterium]